MNYKKIISFLSYLRQGYQEMAFNDDLEKDIYVSRDGELCIPRIHNDVCFFDKIKKYKDPKNNCKSYMIEDRKGNIYEVIQDDIYELGVNAPATLIREVIEE